MTERLGGAVSARLAAVVFERTEGHALFLVNIVEHLVGQGLVVRREGQWTLQDGAEAKVIGLPEGLRQLLIRRLEDLPFEGQRARGGQCRGRTICRRRRRGPILDGGRRSVVKRWRRSSTSSKTSACGSGRMGPAAGATGLPMRCTGRCYDRLGRHGAGNCTGALCGRGGLWRAGNARLRPARRPLRARRRDPRAVDYWQQAGDNAARRNAHHEAIAALRKALASLATSPESLERSQRELTLQLALAELLRATKGWVPDVGEVYTRPIPSASGWGRHRSSLWSSGGSRSFM